MRVDLPVAEYHQGAHIGYPYPKESLPRAGTACNTGDHYKTAGENTSMALPHWTKFETDWTDGVHSPGFLCVGEQEEPEPEVPEPEADLPAPVDNPSDRHSPATCMIEHSHGKRKPVGNGVPGEVDPSIDFLGEPLGEWDAKLTRLTSPMYFRHGGSGQSVLVVIDCQNGFIREANEDKVPAIVELSRRWMQAGRHIVFCRNMSQMNLLDGAANVQLADGLLQAISETAFPERVHVIDECGVSCFNEEFTDLILRHGWDNFGLSGFSSDSCIKATAQAISESGFGRSIALEDVCAEHKEDQCEEAIYERAGDHEKTMQAIGALRNGCAMLSSDFMRLFL